MLSSNAMSQTLTKLRFSRNSFTEVEKENFRKLLDSDDFYTIRLPSNVLSPTGREYVVSSVKAVSLILRTKHSTCVCHCDGVNIVGVNYGSPGSCQYPRPLKVPSKWSFNSHTVLKTSEQAPRSRTPILTEIVGETAEGEEVKPPEKSFWAKYWMYLLPLGLIVMNAITQAMNMAEEQANGGQPQQQAAGAPRGQSTVVRRR
nr:ER membrane protein complex subunit 10 [Ipomoea batatas]